MTRGPRIKAERLYYRGYLRAASIRASIVYVTGFLEVRDVVRAAKVFIKGGVKARLVIADVILVSVSSPSIIADLRARVLHIRRGKGSGRMIVDTLVAHKAYLEHTYAARARSRYTVVGPGTVIDKLEVWGNGVVHIRSPYCSFRTNPCKTGATIVMSYHSIDYKPASSLKQSSPSDQ